MAKYDIKLNPRGRRLLAALLKGHKTRAQLDHICRAANAPDVVFRLRNKGIPIQSRRVPCVDADGRPSNFGEYWLAVKDRSDIRPLLRRKQQ